MKLVKSFWDLVNLFIKISFTCVCVLGMTQYGEIICDWINDMIDSATNWFKELTSE